MNGEWGSGANISPEAAAAGGRTLKWAGTTPACIRRDSPITCVCLGAISNTV